MTDFQEQGMNAQIMNRESIFIQNDMRIIIILSWKHPLPVDTCKHDRSNQTEIIVIINCCSSTALLTESIRLQVVSFMHMNHLHNHQWNPNYYYFFVFMASLCPRLQRQAHWLYRLNHHVFSYKITISATISCLKRNQR